MSWSDSMTEEEIQLQARLEFVNETEPFGDDDFEEKRELELTALRRQYANAELAYQSLKRDYSEVLDELKTTRKVVSNLHRKTLDTDEKFSQLKEVFKQQQLDLDKKTAHVSRLITENESYFNQLNQDKQEFDKRVVHLVKNEMAFEKEKIIRMDRFAEYIPTAMSLIALAAILFYIFRM